RRRRRIWFRAKRHSLEPRLVVAAVRLVRDDAEADRGDERHRRDGRQERCSRKRPLSPDHRAATKRLERSAPELVCHKRRDRRELGTGWTCAEVALEHQAVEFVKTTVELARRSSARIVAGLITYRHLGSYDATVGRKVGALWRGAGIGPSEQTDVRIE